MAKSGTWQRYVNVAAIVSAFASSLTLVAVLIALYFGYQQMTENEAIARGNAARQTFRSYLELAMRNPAFAVPDYDAIKRNPRDQSLYETFVTFMLQSCEYATENFEDDGIKTTCETHIGRHARFFCDTFTNDSISNYNAEAIGDRIVKAVTAAKGSARECTDAKVDELRAAVRDLKDEE